jgi:hypothetical protein
VSGVVRDEEKVGCPLALEETLGLMRWSDVCLRLPLPRGELGRREAHVVILADGLGAGDPHRGAFGADGATRRECHRQRRAGRGGRWLRKSGEHF